MREQILSVPVSADCREKQFQYVPAKAIISVEEEHRVSGDLITVQWGAETIWMFQQDIANRTEWIPEPQYSAAAAGVYADPVNDSGRW